MRLLWQGIMMELFIGNTSLAVGHEILMLTLRFKWVPTDNGVLVNQI